MPGDMAPLTTRHLKKGVKIPLTGLGIFRARKRAARIGRKPRDRPAIRSEASKKRRRYRSAWDERFDSHQNYGIAPGHP
jgi:nucleoid DNA-binding protein